jgi:hypothetical protein
VGYSIAFGHGTPLWGGLAWLGFHGVGVDADPAYAATIPLQAHAMFQLMFAIITPALISGAIVERMRFPGRDRRTGCIARRRRDRIDGPSWGRGSQEVGSDGVLTGQPLT